MRDEEILRKFYTSRDSNTVKYDFDIKELVDNFSLLDFVKNANVACDTLGTDYGGFLVCTPKQYIIGYNSDFGAGPHIASYARCMRDITGGGKITSIDDFTRFGTMCTEKYLCGRLVYEKIGENENRKPIFKGILDIMIDGNISHEVFESFKKFYEDYNNEIEIVSKRTNGTFNVSYFDRDVHKRVDTSNLDSVYSYLEKHADESLVDDEEECIIGVETNKELAH